MKSEKRIFINFAKTDWEGFINEFHRGTCTPNENSERCTQTVESVQKAPDQSSDEEYPQRKSSTLKAKFSSRCREDKQGKGQVENRKTHISENWNKLEEMNTEIKRHVIAHKRKNGVNTWKNVTCEEDPRSCGRQSKSCRETKGSRLHKQSRLTNQSTVPGSAAINSTSSTHPRQRSVQNKLTGHHYGSIAPKEASGYPPRKLNLS